MLQLDYSSKFEMKNPNVAVSRVIVILIEFLRGELDGMHWLVQTDATLEQTQDGLLAGKHTGPSKHKNEYTLGTDYMSEHN